MKNINNDMIVNMTKIIVILLSINLFYACKNTKNSTVKPNLASTQEKSDANGETLCLTDNDIPKREMIDPKDLKIESISLSQDNFSLRPIIHAKLTKDSKVPDKIFFTTCQIEEKNGDCVDEESLIFAENPNIPEGKIKITAKACVLAEFSLRKAKTMQQGAFNQYYCGNEFSDYFLRYEASNSIEEKNQTQDLYKIDQEIQKELGLFYQEAGAAIKKQKELGLTGSSNNQALSAFMEMGADSFAVSVLNYHQQIFAANIPSADEKNLALTADSSSASNCIHDKLLSNLGGQAPSVAPFYVDPQPDANNVSPEDSNSTKSAADTNQDANQDANTEKENKSPAKNNSAKTAMWALIGAGIGVLVLNEFYTGIVGQMGSLDPIRDIETRFLAANKRLEEFNSIDMKKTELPAKAELIKQKIQIEAEFSDLNVQRQILALQRLRQAKQVDEKAVTDLLEQIDSSRNQQKIIRSQLELLDNQKAISRFQDFQTKLNTMKTAAADLPNIKNIDDLKKRLSTDFDLKELPDDVREDLEKTRTDILKTIEKEPVDLPVLQEKLQKFQTQTTKHFEVYNTISQFKAEEVELKKINLEAVNIEALKLPAPKTPGFFGRISQSLESKGITVRRAAFGLAATLIATGVIVAFAGLTEDHSDFERLEARAEKIRYLIEVKRPEFAKKTQ